MLEELCVTGALEELCAAGALEELCTVWVVELLELMAGTMLLDDAVTALLVPLLALLVPLFALLVGVFVELLDVVELPEFVALLVALLESWLSLEVMISISSRAEEELSPLISVAVSFALYGLTAEVESEQPAYIANERLEMQPMVRSFLFIEYLPFNIFLKLILDEIAFKCVNCSFLRTLNF